MVEHFDPGHFDPDHFDTEEEPSVPLSTVESGHFDADHFDPGHFDTEEEPSVPRVGSMMLMGMGR